MANGFKRWWGYLKAKTNSTLEERADPKIQLEQAIREAQDQHRRLREQAANVIANQKQTEMRLNRALGELEKVNGNARQALRHGRRRRASGATRAKAAEYIGAAEALANRLIQLEKRHRRPEDAVPAVGPGRRPGQGRGRAERPRAPAEAGRAPEAAVPARPGQDAGADEHGDGRRSPSRSARTGPTFDEVRQKIEARYAKAKGMAELTEHVGRARACRRSRRPRRTPRPRPG